MRTRSTEPRLRVLAGVAVAACLRCAAAGLPTPVFRVEFDGTTDGVDRDGRTVAPVQAADVAYVPGLAGQALKADRATARVGLADNLIVEAHAEMAARRQGAAGLQVAF